jgi:hypothetical protein
MEFILEGLMMPSNIDKDEMKAALKQALTEWLDKKFSEFGKWSLGAIGAAGLAALTYFILKMNGWNK